MEPSDLPPLPPIKKRKQKSNKRGTMNRSRSFVAEMFHIKNASNKPQKWSNNDIQLLDKLGISPTSKNRNNLNSKINVSPNLHPDLKIAALEEHISSLNIELSETRNNLQKAAEYGQHLIEENQKLELVVLELRNEAAEYIAQLCELREENNTFKLDIESNEYSVNDYENKMYEFKSDKDDLHNKFEILNEEYNNYKNKYEMEINKSRKQYNKNIDQLKEKILVLQNTNHSLLTEGNQVAKKYRKLKQEMHSLENEYSEMCSQYKVQDGGSISGDSPHRLSVNISRRRSHSHSRSRSDKRNEELEEKMDEIQDKNNAHSNDSDNEYKSDPININNKIYKYNQILIECMDLFENIMDDQHIHSPIKLQSLKDLNINLKQPSNDNTIDIELFGDLMDNVRNKLRKQKYGGDIHQRNMSELRDNSKSNSNFIETLEHCVVSTDDENNMNINININKDINILEEEEEEENKHDITIEYEADNEELDNLPNKDMIIEPCDEKQKKCVEEFLVRYSEHNSWKDINNENGDEYQLEIEFNESVNLVNKKNNNISINGKILQSLTNLIENIMGISDINDYKMPYFSLCGWFCGKSRDDCTDYSEHYLNILSALDYNGENREEIYWVIYQLLNIIYKYYNHTQQLNNNKYDRNTNNISSYDNNKENIGENNDKNNESDSESMSMVYTQSKSKYAELRPPKRRRKNKIKGRQSFHPLNDISSDEQQYVE